MRRRCLIIGGAVLLIAATVIGQVIPRPRRPPVSREQFEKIKEGMTRDEVEAIIGGPPGDYRTREYVGPPLGSHYALWDGWWGDEGMIFVFFDKTGRANGAHYAEPMLYYPKPTVYERLRAWLKL